MVHVALVACGASKGAAPVVTRELYTGSLFRAARRDVDGRLPWFVVSAFHVLLSPTTVVAPYEFSLHQVPAGRQRDLWAARVAGMLAQQLHPRRSPAHLSLVGVHVELHAGETYAVPLRPALAALGAIVDTLPPGRLPLGRRLAWYAARHRARAAAPSAEDAIRRVRDALLAAPPEGVDAAYVLAWFTRMDEALRRMWMET